jgi:hypothetical protein
LSEIGSTLNPPVLWVWWLDFNMEAMILASEVFMAVTTKIFCLLGCNAKPDDVYEYFGRHCCFHLQNRS